MHVTSTSQFTCLTSFTLRRSELRGQGPDLSRPLPSFSHTSFPSRAVLFYSGASLVFLQLLLFTGCSLPSVVSLFLPVLHRCPSVKLNVMSAATCFYLSQISAFRVCLRLPVARFHLLHSIHDVLSIPTSYSQCSCFTSRVRTQTEKATDHAPRAFELRLPLRITCCQCRTT